MNDTTIMANIWDFLSTKNVVCIPINTQVNSHGQLVMGSGMAKDAYQMFPEIAESFGQQIQRGNIFPNYVDPVTKYKLKGLPTKRNWREPSEWDYIFLCIEHLAEKGRPELNYFIPLLGAGLGGLPVDEVRDYLEGILSALPNVKLVIQPS